MTAPEKCPKCGSCRANSSQRDDRFGCGSSQSYAPDGSPEAFLQSCPCEVRCLSARNTTLTAERDALLDELDKAKAQLTKRNPEHEHLREKMREIVIAIDPAFDNLFLLSAMGRPGDVTLADTVVRLVHKCREDRDQFKTRLTMSVPREVAERAMIGYHNDRISMRNPHTSMFTHLSAGEILNIEIAKYEESVKNEKV